MQIWEFFFVFVLRERAVQETENNLGDFSISGARMKHIDELCNRDISFFCNGVGNGMAMFVFC